MKPNIRSLGLLSLLTACGHAAITLDLSNAASIRQAASTAAAGMVSYYTGNETGSTPGLLPQPYYWWSAGAMFGSLLDYWYLTDDSQYNAIVTQGIVFQTGPDRDFMPTNQTKTLGNDDQGFWAMAAMSAVEYGFPNPSQGQPQWLGLAETVFNEQVARWAAGSDVCDAGGLKWQIYSFNAGYNLRNAASNGAFFNLGSRLAAYSKNATYAEWAKKTWDWVSEVGLLTREYYVFDSVDDNDNCSDVQNFVWSVNSGLFLAGAANMYNHTNGSSLWEDRIRGLINNTITVFTEQDILHETICEPNGNCNIDQRFYKGLLIGYMANTMLRAPFTSDLLSPVFKASATAAAKACNGGTDGNQCSTYWVSSDLDFQTGVPEQLNAMQAFQANLLPFINKPLASAAQSGNLSSSPTTNNSSQNNTNNQGPNATHTNLAVEIADSSRSCMMISFGVVTAAVAWIL